MAAGREGKRRVLGPEYTGGIFLDGRNRWEGKFESQKRLERKALWVH